MSFDDEPADAFSRLHEVFTFHLGVAVALAWMTAVYAAFHAPWVGDIRALLDPVDAGRAESTGSFLFGLPLVLTVAWAAALFGRNCLPRARIGSQGVAFGLAAAIVVLVFYLGVDRAVAAILLGGA